MVILQGHYRSPFDYSEDSLVAAKAGYDRLVGAVLAVRRAIDKAPAGEASQEVTKLAALTEERFRSAMDDDFGSSGALAALFDMVGEANRVARDPASTRGSLEKLDDVFRRLGGDVLGLIKDKYTGSTNQDERVERLERIILDLRNELRKERAFNWADRMRGIAGKSGISFSDQPAGSALVYPPDWDKDVY